MINLSVRLRMMMCAVCMVLTTILLPESIYADMTERHGSNFHNNGAALQCDSLNVDLGIVEPDSIGVGEFRYSNAGNKPLVITDVFTTCGCTRLDMDTEPLPPGGKGVINVRFISKGLQEGPFCKRVRVMTNSETEPTIVFTITGRIKRKLLR